MDQMQEMPSVPSSHKKQWEWSVVIAAVVLVAVFIVWWFVLRPEPVEAPSSTVGVEEKSEALGGALLEGAQNPVQGKLPEATPVPNPIEGAYQNPFE